jgi:hypothetical protein
VLAAFLHPIDLRGCVFQPWVEEDEILQVLNDDLNAAQNAHAVELKKAAIAGAPMPNESSTQEIEKKILHQLIRLWTTRRSKQ